MLGGVVVVLLVLTAVGGQRPGATERSACSHQAVLDHLNLTRDNDLYSLTRPVQNFSRPTNVVLDIVLFAILEVRETEQTFVPYFWKFMSWENEYIGWDPSDFCGIDKIQVPTHLLWKPDFTIEELIAKDKAPPSPFLTITSNGMVLVQNDQVLTITCRMHVHQFPFDMQSCNISFRSFVHSIEEMRVFYNTSSKEATKESRELMRTQYEWLFENITVSRRIVEPFGVKQDMIIFTINMKRRSILYIVNFLLPVLFFLFLDLASFMISECCGEKLSFKVTVLLAVTVLQLILNDILPSSSNKIPLIAVYCIGVFTLMMLSLLETILVMYLMRKDFEHQDGETEEDRSLRGDKRGHDNFHNCGGEEKTWNSCMCVWDVSADETASEQLKTSGSRLTERPQGAEKLSEDLREAVETLTLLLSSRREERRPGYWTRKAQFINKCFFICYAVAAGLFLLSMVLKWNGRN